MSQDTVGENVVGKLNKIKFDDIVYIVESLKISEKLISSFGPDFHYEVSGQRHPRDMLLLTCLVGTHSRAIGLFLFLHYS